MNVRGMKREDIEKVRKLHHKYFPDLEFPDFFSKFYGAFIIEDEEDGMIMAGGVQMMGEAILVTDKDKDITKIYRALIEAQKAVLYLGDRFGLEEIVAFVKDNDAYARHLVRHGFYPRSLALAIKVPQWEKTNPETTNSQM
jgi:hypothetical protein